MAVRHQGLAEFVRMATKNFTPDEEMVNLVGMNPQSCNIRRATLEDVPFLRPLWNDAQLPVNELEKRFTEFQLVEDEEGELLGAIGLTMVQRHGHIHSEAFIHPEAEDMVRPLLWDRLNTLARNHGLIRFWCLEEAPFWRYYAGFKEATSTELENMPAGFGDAAKHWLTLELMDENHPLLNMEQHLEMFRQEQLKEMEKMRSRANFLRNLATIIAFVLFSIIMLGGVLLLRKRNPQR